MSHSYVRIPPDSTGKLILSEERRVITYDNNTGGTFEVGQTVTGTGGATGVITGVRTKGFPANEGRLYLEQNSGTWSDNEAIQVDAVTFANVNTSGANGETVDDVYIQSNVIADSDRPSDTLKIDSDGAAHVNFDGKAPFVEAQGELVTTERKLVWAPLFDYDFDDPNLVNNEYRLQIASKTWPTLPQTNAGIRIQGDTSGTKGRMCAFPPAYPNMVYITDSEGNWSPGETIRAVEDPEGHFFTLQGVVVPSITINSQTKSVDLKLPANAIDYQHAIRVSNVYIPQARAETTTIAFSASAGATSEAGVTRRIGLFDDFNGVFFELINSDGTDATYDPTGALNTSGTKFYVVHRTSTKGNTNPSDEIRVEQTDFNVNQLDGSDAQGFAPDFNNLSRVWIDWPGGGAGTVEFGIYDDRGYRIVAHRIKLQNNNEFNVNATDGHKLPIRQEILTNGGGTPGAETSIKLAEAYVLRSVPTGEIQIQTLLHGNSTTYYENLDDSRGEVPLFAMQANKQLNGVDNRMFARLHDINVNLFDSRMSRSFSNNEINTTTDSISLTNHGLQDGDPVFFKQGNNTVTGLTDWGYYYAVAEDDNTLKLATSYINAVNATPVVVDITDEGEGAGHLLEEPSDTSVLLRIRVNSQIADSVWSNHNASRSGTSQTNGTGTGFRLSPYVTITDASTGYTVGDLLELDSGITTYRESVLEVTKVGGSGEIERVRVANNSVGHTTESDGTTSANFGSYNGQITSAITHKANGVGLSSTTGTGAQFTVSVEWGHAFWWVENYAQWNEWNFADKGEMFTDFTFALSESKHKQGNLTLTGQARTQKLHNAKITASANWTEII